MKTPTTLLLCHHGTAGAKLAEELAYRVAVPGTTTVVQLLIVPEFWAGMQGDDWLNNASTRDAFAAHVETTLENDARCDLSAVEAHCRERGLAYRAVMRYGDVAKIALEVAAESAAQLVVIGPPRIKGEEGVNSRMDLDTLARGLKCPLLIAPRP